MSYNIYYAKVGKSVEVERDVKYKLGPYLWGHDGSLLSRPAYLDEHDVPYLQEWADEGVEGAIELINAIDKHGKILVEIK